MKRLSKPPFHGRGKIEIIERVGYSPLYIQAHAASRCVPPQGRRPNAGSTGRERGYCHWKWLSLLLLLPGERENGCEFTQGSGRCVPVCVCVAWGGVVWEESLSYYL